MGFGNLGRKWDLGLGWDWDLGFGMGWDMSGKYSHRDGSHGSGSHRYGIHGSNWNQNGGGGHSGCNSRFEESFFIDYVFISIFYLYSFVWKDKY